MWQTHDEFALQTAERPESLRIAPDTEFPFVDQETRATQASRQLQQWQNATRAHPDQRQWLPHYARQPPPGYRAPFAYGLFGAPGPRPGGLLKLGLAALGAWMIYKGVVSPNRKTKRGEGVVVAGLGAGLLYGAWRGR